MSKASNVTQPNRDVRASGNPGRENARATRNASATSSGRIVSIDALRGFDMFWIIGGATVIQSLAAAWNLPALNWLSAQMEHVEWEGFNFIDLIFPLFLFLIGAAIPFSLGKRIARGDSFRQIYRHVILRVVILVVLGMMVNGSLLSYHLAEFELTYSVLQMLALGYLVAAILYLHFGLAWQIVATLTMLIGYWALLAFVPGPGHQVGVVAPGCNVGDWVTNWIVGEWRGYQVGWIVGVLGHASTAMLGVLTGHLLRSGMTGKRKVVWMAAWGLASLVIGLFWSGWAVTRWPDVALFGTPWNEWPVWCPIIKNRWTSSYVLYAGGWSLLLLAAFYLVIDVYQWRRWAFPFIVIGSNSIFAYMCWQLGSGVFRSAAEVFLGGLKRYMPAVWFEPLAWVGATATLCLLLWYLYRNKTFIRA